MPEDTDESPVSVITPLMMDDPETLASELSAYEIACLAGTANSERLSQVSIERVPLAPEERTLILN